MLILVSPAASFEMFDRADSFPRNGSVKSGKRYRRKSKDNNDCKHAFWL
jgi:hypothetical protein